MDITLVPPTSILSHHSHEIYQPLLPSSMPRRRSPYPYTCPAPRSPFAGCSSYRTKRLYEPPPLLDGTCPLDLLPDEIILSILSYLDWDELLSIRSVDRRISELALSPALYHTLTLLSLPPSPLPSVLASHILPATRHLHLHLFPYPSPNRSIHPSSVLLSLLNALPPDQLLSLSLPFSAPYLPMSEMSEIARIDGKIEQLDLRGSGLVGPKWGGWLKNVGTSGRGLRELDLGFTSISALPMENSRPPTPDPLDRSPTPLHPFRSLVSLSLASCSSLPASVLADFLATLPPTLQRIDLSRLDQITFPALWDMRVTTTTEDEDRDAITPTALKEIKVVGIDHLTRLDVRRLKRHWVDQRRACFLRPIAATIQIPAKRVWGVPRTPEMQTVPLSPPDTPVVPSKQSRLEVGLPFYPRSSSRTEIHFGLPTPPSSQRSSPTHHAESAASEVDQVSINVIHSAILESEDEAGYRQFIGEVAGGTLGVGLGLGWDEVQGEGEAWVEVDGGGVM